MSPVSIRRRTVAAIAVVGAGVVIPCAVWWLVGSDSARREADALVTAAGRRSDARAESTAYHVAMRLERLREEEASRPYAHDEHIAFDDTCGCEELRDTDRRPPDADATIAARIVVDDRGTASVVGPSASRLSAAIEPVVEELLQAVRFSPARDELLEPAPPGERTPERDATERDPFALVAQGPYLWRTVALDGEPTLFALREIRTDARSWVQGIVVDRAALERDAGSPDAPDRPDAFRLVHGPASSAGEATVPISGTAWRAVVDTTPDLAAARAEGARVEAGFRRAFALGAGMLLVAGALAAGLLWQRDRVDRARSRFAATAAHELRTPLAGVRLELDALLRAPELDGAARERVVSVSDDVDRLGRIVHNVLRYASLDRGRPRVRPEIGDAGETVRAIVRRLAPALESAGATIRLDVLDPLPAARFDAEALDHVVTNLIDNAEKFSRGATDRTIEVAVEPHADGREVVVAVRDHGRGTPDGKPVDGGEGPSGASADAGGLGIGLLLSRRLVQAMGGTFSTTEANGGGARYAFTLPAEADLPMSPP